MSDLIAEARKPGRPKQQAEVAMKKGRASWKPASLNNFDNKEPGYRYRMVRKDPDNLAKKAAEHWETVSALQSPNTKYQDSGRIEEGKSLTSAQEGKDWVLQRIPEEIAKERDDYYNALNARHISGLTAHIKEGMKKDGFNTHGNITVSSRSGTQIIE